jgi:hypothetical protein
MMMSPAAGSALAQALRGPTGVPIGELFSFVSGLYFRGKLAYATRFASPPEGDDPVVGRGVMVITPNAGLRSVETQVTLDSLRAFAAVEVDLENATYRQPLERSARALLSAVGPDCEVVLLGSIASGKYVELLLPIFGDRLLFPTAFVGRGDMSRGGLMLRSADEGLELEYAPLAGAERRGRRPPKLAPPRKTHA